MLIYKVYSQEVLSNQVSAFLKLIKPEEYKMTFYQESESFDQIKKNMAGVSKVAGSISLEFETANSPELVELFYNENTRNMTLACQEYNINYSYNTEFDILIKLTQTTPEMATDEIVQVLERLRKKGIELGFKDKHHIREIMSFFFEKNFFQLVPHTWECNVGQETHIKPGFVWKTMVSEDGQRKSVMAQVNFSLQRIGRILYPKKADLFLNPLFEVLNNRKKYTVYIRELKGLDSLLLPPSDLIKINCSVEPSNDIRKIEKFLGANGKVTLSYNGNNGSDQILFRRLQLNTCSDEHAGIHITFDEEEQRDVFLQKIKEDIKWELVYEE